MKLQKFKYSVFVVSKSKKSPIISAADNHNSVNEDMCKNSRITHCGHLGTQFSCPPLEAIS